MILFIVVQLKFIVSICFAAFSYVFPVLHLYFVSMKSVLTLVGKHVFCQQD